MVRGRNMETKMKGMILAVEFAEIKIYVSRCEYLQLNMKSASSPHNGEMDLNVSENEPSAHVKY